MPIPEQYTEVFYGIQLSSDTELMGVTMAWATGAGAPTEEECLGHYNRFVLLFKPMYPNLFTFPTARFATGTAGGDFTQEVAPDPVASGTGAASVLPNNCAVLVAKITAAGGRRNRGRLFFPSPAESSVSENGTLTTGSRNLWQGAVDDWIADEQTIGWGTPALLHQSGPASPTTVTNLIVRPRIATQRRRMRP